MKTDPQLILNIDPLNWKNVFSYMQTFYIQEVSWKVKNVRDWYTVKNLYNKGKKIKQIAREIGMSKNTVKRLIKSEEPP